MIVTLTNVADGLSKLFQEIRQKTTIQELSPEYQKFAEWLRIEVAATVYHLFLAEDNSPELFAQAKRIHSLVPYGTLKQVIRFANPAAVMAGVLDLFLAQPFGAKSLLQRIFGMALNDGVRSVQRSIDVMRQKVNEPVFTEKIHNYVESDEDIKNALRAEAATEGTDLLVSILRTELFKPALTQDDIARVVNAWVAWNSAVENVSPFEGIISRFNANVVARLIPRCVKAPKRLLISNPCSSLKHANATKR